MYRRVSCSLFAAWIVFSSTELANAQSEKEKERNQLLLQLGLEKKAPASPTEGISPETDAPQPSDSTPAGTVAEPAAQKVESPRYVGSVHRTLIHGCQGCHSEQGIAAKTTFVLVGDLRLDYESTRRFIDPNSSDSSLLLKKAAGTAHGGGLVFKPSSGQYRGLQRWIEAGGNFSATQKSVAAPEPKRPRKAPKPLLRPAIVPSTPAPVSKTETEKPLPSQEPTPGDVVPNQQTYYDPTVHGLLRQSCGGCHASNGIAGASRLVLTDDANVDFYNVVALVDFANPRQSLLVSKALGVSHGGGAVVGENSEVVTTLLSWIEGGALGPAAPPAAAAATDSAQPQSAPENIPSHRARSALGQQPSGMAPVPAGHGLALAGLRLNGRFDLNFERRGIGDAQPGGSRNALANYHRFVFLTRESAHDPFGFTAELLTLQMWQAHVRIAPETVPIKVWIKAGKLLVPFGTEPLFHQYYGGHGGFDQRLMPTVWAREGAALHAFHRRRDLSLTWDLYAVRGYRLRVQDSVLNLQNDFSTDDPVSLGYGQRLGAAWGPLSAYYSSFLNNIGFDRLLFLQAADFTIGQWHGIPVLERFTAGFGLLRADVSGGGAGKDYYHFASYFRMRYFFTDNLWFQYRQGLRTINNRRYLTGDDTRWGSEDGSTHNVALWARYRGISGGVSYFFNLEKKNEIDDDFFRMTVVYDF